MAQRLGGGSKSELGGRCRNGLISQSAWAPDALPMLKSRWAGVGSTSPPGSRARTSKEWAPPDREDERNGLVHAEKAAESILHSNVDPGTLEWKPK